MEKSYTCGDLMMALLLPAKAEEYLQELMEKYWNSFLGSDDIPPELPKACDLPVFHALALIRKDIAMRRFDAQPWESQMNLLLALIQGVEFLMNHRGVPLRENLVRSNRGRALLMVPYNLTAAELGNWYKDPDLYYEYENLQYSFYW